MLWRESYSPRLIREKIRTPFSDESLLLIGSRSLSASREVEIWWRLCEEDFMGFAVEVLPEACQDEAGILRAGSRQARIRFNSEALSIVQELPDDRAFCAVVRDGIAELIVVGPPTEEVWDEASTVWRSIRT